MCLTIIISFIILLYLFSSPYIRLQQRQSRFKYTFHIVPGTTAPFIAPFCQTLCSLWIPLHALCDQYHVTVIFTSRWTLNLRQRRYCFSHGKSQNRSALGRGCVRNIARFLYSENHTGAQHKLILWRTLEGMTIVEHQLSAIFPSWKGMSPTTLQNIVSPYYGVW